jgi:hypothetical protein
VRTPGQLAGAGGGKAGWAAATVGGLVDGVQWGPVKTGALGSGSLASEPPGGLVDGVQSTMKSANTWLLTAWHGMKSSSNSANSNAHLAILSVMFGLWRMTLSGYEVTTEIL